MASNRMAKVVSFIFGKGGTGKTTCCVNLAVALRKKGLKVVIVDLDPNGGVADYLGFHPFPVSPTITEVLMNDYCIWHAVRSSPYDGFDFLPSSPKLLEAGDLVLKLDEEQYMYFDTQVISRLKDVYDYILIDCGASLDSLVQATWLVSDLVAFTCSCDVMSLRSFRHTVRAKPVSLNKYANPIKYGTILTRQRPEDLDQPNFEDFSKNGIPILGVIPWENDIENPTVDDFPFLSLKHDSKAAQSLFSLADSIVNRLELPEKGTSDN